MKKKKLPPFNIEPLSTFHDSLDQARTKSEVIDILCHRGSSAGWFSGINQTLWMKMQDLRMKE